MKRLTKPVTVKMMVPVIRGFDFFMQYLPEGFVYKYMQGGLLTEQVARGIVKSFNP